MTVAILSVVGILMVGGVMLVFAFMPKKESVKQEMANSNQLGGTASTPTVEKPVAAANGAAKTSAPGALPGDRVVRRQVSAGLSSAKGELGAAMKSWRSGESYETFMESDIQISKLDLPEWKDRGYHLEKSLIKLIPSVSEVERQLWLTMRFMDQDAEPLMRLYSVKLDENGKLMFEKVEDKAAPPEVEKPARPSPVEPTEPAEPAKQNETPEPTEPTNESAAEAATADDA
jgi:hypothetical protein